MSLVEKIYAKLEKSASALMGSVCIDLDDIKIKVDHKGQPQPDLLETDCTLTLTQDTLQGLIDGSVDGMAAYFSGDIKITGDMGVALSLASLLKK